jgi:hypothetical protein
LNGYDFTIKKHLHKVLEVTKVLKNFRLMLDQIDLSELTKIINKTHIVKDQGGDQRGVNGSLIKFFHKNLAYVPCLTPQAKTPEIK